MDQSNGVPVNSTLAYVSYALIAMMFLLLIAALVKWVVDPSADQNIIIMVAQAVIGMCSSVAGYWIGSSDGSKKKDLTIKEIKNETNT